MNITFSKNLPDKELDLILGFNKNNVDAELVKQYALKFNENDFSGEAKEITSFYGKDKVQKIYLLGLGEDKDIPKSGLFYRSCVHQNRKKLNKTIALHLGNLNEPQVFNAVSGTLAGLKQNGTFKYEKEIIPAKELIIITDNPNHEGIINEAALFADTQLSMMHLVDMPSNIKTPEYIGKTALESAEKYGYKAIVYNKSQLERMGLKSLLSVGQGSANPPVMIVAEYKPTNHISQNPAIGLVGKGISFDTGGISIKPSANMGYMKSDMAGAAAVLGCMELIAKLQLNIHIVAVIPCAENSVDAESIRPGDIIGSYSGKSIEVIDTDAEGRLILADGLSYLIRNYNPEYVLDLATLTGSIVQTLGYFAAGMFTQSENLALKITEASETSGDRVWRMPLWEDYLPDMLSDMADIKNLSGKPVAGSITAAKFLEFFTENHKNWMHLDIAGVAFTDSEFTKQRSATGYGIRLLTEFAKAVAEQK